MVCAIDDKEIGVGVEKIPESLDSDFLKFCFSDGEIDDILSSPVPCVSFAEWWTKKESYLKLIGTGLVDNIPAVLSGDVSSTVSFDVEVDVERHIVYSVCQYVC